MNSYVGMTMVKKKMIISVSKHVSHIYHPA